MNQLHPLKKTISFRTAFLAILFVVLFFSSLFFGLKYNSLKHELEVKQSLLEKREFNKDILLFVKLFVSKVLKSDQDIDFETRLELENAVRDLEDSEVLAQWKKFTESQTEQEAQTEVRNLLEMLIAKIEIE